MSNENTCEDLVTIITVCFNSENTIEDTLKSVLSQTYQNLEYIVIDGMSNDGTLSIVRKYQPAFGEKLMIISEPDLGIYNAMNKGIRHAKGSLIGIINSDDYYEADAIEKIMRYKKGSKYQILYGATKCIRDGIEDSITLNMHYLLNKRSIGHPSTFITKAVYDKFGVYDEQYSCVADYDFFLRMDREEEVEFVPVYELIANFRTGGMSASSKAWLDLLKLRKNYGFISPKEYQKEIFKDRLYKIFH